MAPGHSPCASCKLLRRRCAKDCVFAPYFPSHDTHKFALVHRVFGASNVSKMLQELPVNQRGDAVSSLVFEANARTRDPVYGCVGAISYLQNQVTQLQMQLAMAQAEILCIQMQQEPSATAPVNGSNPGQAAHTTMLTDDVVSTVSSEDTSYSCLPNHDHCFNFSSSNVTQYEYLKKESSYLWT